MAFEELQREHGKRLEIREFQGLAYARLRDDHHHLPRGTVFFPSGRRVMGYPHIGRILALASGLEAQFRAPVWAEEKLNGYNVRVVQEAGRFLALTRGGFVCPFTTHRLPDLLDLDALRALPEVVVCAEVVGPENPYVLGHPPHVSHDVRAFVFDFMRVGEAGFLPYREKLCLLEALGLPSVPRYGRFDLHQVIDLDDLVRDLDRRGCEGLVFKEDSPRDKRAKYVTASAALDDIGMNAANLMELPPEYFTGRVLRLALFLVDRGEAAGSRAEALGHAFLDGLAEMIRRFREEGQGYLRYRCRFREAEAAEVFFHHLAAIASRQVRLRLHSLERDGEQWRLTFDRVPVHINGLLQDLLTGTLVFD